MGSILVLACPSVPVSVRSKKMISCKVSGRNPRVISPGIFVFHHELVFTALKGTHFYTSFVVTAAGVVPCGSPKKGPRTCTSSIVQFIFYFWAFEISGNILRDQKIS